MPITDERAETGLYEAAEAFRDRALLEDDSLFTPGRAVWTSEALDDFHDRFVVRAETGDESFDEKLRLQLEEADDHTIQLAAELLYVHFLAPAGMGRDSKLEDVKDVLSLMSAPVDVPEHLAEAFEKGVARFGAAHTHRPHMVRYLLQFVRSFKQRPEERRRDILGDPWELKEFLFELDLHGARIQAEALLHLLHPTYFEPIVSYRAKESIAEAWEDLVEDPDDDLDRRILQIREQLEDEYGEDFAFYEPRIRAVWESDPEPWDEFVDWARRFYRWEGFDRTERDYKLEVASDLRDVRQAIAEGGTWIDELDSALRTNLVPWQTRDDFMTWCRQDEARAADALEFLWGDDPSLVERVDRFEEVAVAPISGAKVRLTSVLLMALDPTAYPPYAKTAFDKGFELTGHPPPRDDATPGERYRHALAFLDRFLEQAADRELELRDRLDAQGVLWCITKWDDDSPAVDEWGKDTLRQLKIYRGEIPPPPPNGPKGDPLAELAGELLLERSFLARIKRLLEAKGQVIFYGPPGTGKTYVARKLAETLTRGGGRVRLVQFHPSYAYEDFVEGYRPSDDAGASGFALMEGPLKRIADMARQDPDDPHVLIIDEINRGNIAKVFGELYFLLEYRDEAIDLQYSGEGFRLPPNLWIIGTMNTADRSIALMDAALRRRFYFVPFFPQEPPIEGLLGRWLDRHAGDGLRWVADVVREANERLDDPHFAIGPSYFLKEDLTEEWVETVWRHSVMPYLEERFFGDQEALARFRLEELRAAVAGTVPGEGRAGGDDADEEEVTGDGEGLAGAREGDGDGIEGA